MSRLIKAPSCVVAGCGRSAKWSKRNKDGTLKYKNTCSKHNQMELNLSKKSYCENVDGRLGYKCTTTILGPYQLQIDHIDGNRYNNDERNKQTLCACCHAYKTHINQNHLTRYNKDEEVDNTFDSLFQSI